MRAAPVQVLVRGGIRLRGRKLSLGCAAAPAFGQVTTLFVSEPFILADAPEFAKPPELVGKGSFTTTGHR